MLFSVSKGDLRETIAAVLCWGTVAVLDAVLVGRASRLGHNRGAVLQAGQKA